MKNSASPTKISHIIKKTLVNSRRGRKGDTPAKKKKPTKISLGNDIARTRSWERKKGCQRNGKWKDATRRRCAICNFPSREGGESDLGGHVRMKHWGRESEVHLARRLWKIRKSKQESKKRRAQLVALGKRVEFCC